jgi:putative iron-regulated protein
LLTGCGSDDEKESSDRFDAAALKTYANVVAATYEDTLSLAKKLDEATTAFVAAPSAATLTAARTSWLAAREPYLQTEVFRFYDGPIDNPEDGPEGLINAWPVDEAYIDYVKDDAAAGIINDPSISIDETALASLNEKGGEQNIATGFHAIEFLLWGQDQSTTGPGERPYTDYVTAGEATAKHPDRRAKYLTTTAALLVADLQRVNAAWQAGTQNYRAEFESVPTSEGLSRVLRGLIILSGFETGGERLQTALDSGSQEDEHSCFSDNTHRDMVQDVQGMLNVWTGTYKRLDGSSVSGTGIREIVSARNADLAKQLDTQIAKSLTLANAIVPPFDQEIALGNSAGRARVQALIDSLRDQEKQLEEVFRLLGLTVSVVE